MKMHFSLVLSGKESLEKKFNKTLMENPGTHLDLIRCFGSCLMLAFGLNEEDAIVMETFRAGKMEENEEKKICEKQVDL